MGEHCAEQKEEEAVRVDFARSVCEQRVRASVGHVKPDSQLQISEGSGWIELSGLEGEGDWEWAMNFAPLVRLGPRREHDGLVAAGP